jgi:hypothetical protein
MIAASLVAAAAIGGLLGLGFVVVAPLLSPEFAELREIPLMALLFAAGSGLFATTLVADQALIGLLRSALQLARNVIAALARLALLGVFAVVGVAAGALVMIGSTTLSFGLSMLALVLYAAWMRVLHSAFPFRWDFLGAQWTSALRHHLLNLAIQVPGWVMPLIAVAVLSAEVNAGFFFAWQLVGFASFINAALFWMLYASASRDPDSLPYWGWLTLRLSVLAAIASAITLWLVGPFVLGLLGPGYAEYGSEALIVLPLTLFPISIKGLFIAVHRVRNTVTAAAGPVAIGAALEIIGASAGVAWGGLIGLGVGLFIAMVVEIVPMFPTVFEAVIRPRETVRST